MRYCTECQAVEQGSESKPDLSLSRTELLLAGAREAHRLGITLTFDEALEWGRDITSLETCASCGAEDSMRHFDEDYGQDR